jgi:hypothetical protein
MKRTPLIVIAFATVIALVAWHAHAHADSLTPRASADSSAPRFPPIPSPTSPRRIDEYGKLRWRDEKARLDNAAIEFQADPTASCYLICYDGRVAREGEARRRCLRAANYLVKRRGIEARRVLTVDGGFREDLTVEIWPVPAGASPPMSSPTVDPSEVKFVNAPRRRGRGRR